MSAPRSGEEERALAVRYLARIRRADHPSAAADPVGALGQAAVDLLQGRELVAPALPPLVGGLVLEPGWEIALEAIPGHLRAGLLRYFVHGIETGGFLRAVLENDLQKATSRCSSLQVDVELRDIVFFLYNFAPCGSWGTPAAVDRWLRESAERKQKGEEPLLAHPTAAEAGAA